MTGATANKTARCAAYYPDLDARCGAPGQAVIRACVHEHVTETVACEAHIAITELGYCLACMDADGHDCPITITLIGGGAS